MPGSHVLAFSSISFAASLGANRRLCGASVVECREGEKGQVHFVVNGFWRREDIRHALTFARVGLHALMQ